jgi:hypothetical protein
MTGGLLESGAPMLDPGQKCNLYQFEKFFAEEVL